MIDTECILDSRLRLSYNNLQKTIDVFLCCTKSFYKPVKSLTINEVLSDENFISTLTNIYNSITKEYRQLVPACYELYYGNKNYCELTELQIIENSIQKTCNLTCSMCRNNIVIDKEEANLYFKVLEKLKNGNLNTIGLTMAGEPFYYKKETFDYINKLDANTDCKELLIISNLTLLNDDDILQLKNIQNKGININLIASIDGITENTYQKIRRNKLFSKVMHNSELLIKNNVLKQINFVAQPDNINELCLSYEYWHNINNLQFNLIPLNGRNSEYYKELIKTDEYSKYLKLLE